MMIKPNRNLLWSALVAACLTKSIGAAADTVWVSKDCTGGPCTVQGGPYPTLGFFRLTGSSFGWSATYTGTPQRFWVSQGGANMADTQLSTSNGDLGGTANLPLGNWYISIKTALMGPGNYSVQGPAVHGDPHITTTNGVHYDLQGAGEFVLLKHSDNGFEVQTRMTPLATVAPLPPDPHTGLSSCVSLNTAAAIRAGRQRVTYQPNLSGQPDPSGMQLRVDGQLVRFGAGGLTLNDGTKIFRDAATGEVRVDFRDQSLVRITPHWWKERGVWYLDFDLTPPNRSMGIVGEIPREGGWLPALSDGTSMGPMPTSLTDRFKALYVKFADSWRVSDSTTLFDYAPHTSTKTYTMKTWPPEDGICELPFTVPLIGVNQDVAERACKGVFIPHLKRSCVQDVMVTGNLDIGKGYVLSQGLPRYKIRVPNGKPNDVAKE
ncbi:hypothetical protein ACNRBS_10870 [Ralstonia pseudosolanacearum]|uniref:hypothetical protein n=2 Tax=Ralstonia pseudosolanacearum TaxID=1310165 RepID=UPI001F3CF271